MVDEIYEGKKAHLRPLHDRVPVYSTSSGPTSRVQERLRQLSKQEAVGAKSLPAHERLKEMPADSMCRYTTRLGSADEVDAQVQEWIRLSYDQAG